MVAAIEATMVAAIVVAMVAQLTNLVASGSILATKSLS